jgi:hypothetical protein
MSEVRRVVLVVEKGWERALGRASWIEADSREVIVCERIFDHPEGASALLSWKEWERLQAVVDAARNETKEHGRLAETNGYPCHCRLCVALRALDGEQKTEKEDVAYVRGI